MEGNMGVKNGVFREEEGKGELWRRLTLPVERKDKDWWWDGGYRWFKSTNVIPLERYRTSVEMTRIRKVLLGRW
jgi:hypothetical protein